MNKPCFILLAIFAGSLAGISHAQVGRDAKAAGRRPRRGSQGNVRLCFRSARL